MEDSPENFGPKLMPWKSIKSYRLSRLAQVILISWALALYANAWRTNVSVYRPNKLTTFEWNIVCSTACKLLQPMAQPLQFATRKKSSMSKNHLGWRWLTDCHSFGVDKLSIGCGWVYEWIIGKHWINVTLRPRSLIVSERSDHPDHFCTLFFST